MKQVGLAAIHCSCCCCFCYYWFLLQLNIDVVLSFQLTSTTSNIHRLFRHQHHPPCSLQAVVNPSENGSQEQFHHHHAHQTPLVVLMPAFNEEFRIRETLDAYSSFLASDANPWPPDCCSILVANDGSTDNTASVVEQYAQNECPIPLECIPLVSNKGKGGALAFGIEHIASTRPSSACVLMADADGSAAIDNLAGMVQALYTLANTNRKDDDGTRTTDFFEQPLLVNGCRSYASAATGRLIFRWGFRWTVRIIVGNLGVRDSQCGFKLLTLGAAQQLYRDLHLDGWGHDVEVLYRAQQLGIPVCDQNVDWEDKDGSKLAASPGGVVAVAVRMFWEVLQVRLGYTIGGWEVKKKGGV